jgi:multiphosphoryl transfer protein
VVGIVVVSHSRRLAEAAVQLALEMAHGASPPIQVAAGLAGGAMGTDATRVREAIDQVACPDGVVVLMDLGSAVLSAELALELRNGDQVCPVMLSGAPLVEGLVVAVALAATGAGIHEVAHEAARAGEVKAHLLDPEAAHSGAGAGATQALAPVELVITNEHGLHARPAAQLVSTVSAFDAEVTVRNLSVPGPAVSAASMSALITLGALPGHHLEVVAAGPEAEECLRAITTLVAATNFSANFAANPVRPGPGPGPGPDPARPDPDPWRADPPPPTPAGASPGIAIGPKATLRPPASDLTATSGAPTPVVSERQRLLAALAASRQELFRARRLVARQAGESEAGMFDAHLVLLDDAELAGRALELVSSPQATADLAWQSATSRLIDRFAALADPYQRARADDVRALGDQVLGHLQGRPSTGSESPSGIVVAADLTPAQAALLDPAKVSGIATAFGTPLSHAALLVRSLGIPAVVGAGEAVLDAPDGTTVVVDGTAGVVVVDPDPVLAGKYRAAAAGERVRSRERAGRAAGPAVTTDGTPIRVVANIASRLGAEDAMRFGADGIGLLRTEFLFADRRRPPDEEEQYEVYLSLAEALGDRRLTIRTLDAGGDKPIPYMAVDAGSNPFLGSRGLRLSLRHPQLFKGQLRAIARTALRHPVTVLFPMVTTIEEVRAARVLLAEAAMESGCAPGVLPAGLEVGAMVEVPAFALRVGAVAALLDVLSIGTNDLSQYALAADRGNPAVAALADPLDPGVLKLIAESCRAGGMGCRMAVCGEVAADPAAAAVLVGLGVRELSVDPPAVPRVKDAVCSLSIVGAEQLAGHCLDCDSAGEVRALLATTLPPDPEAG